MNRLKYVFGINVPRRIPSNAAVLTEGRPREVRKRHQSGVHLSKSTRFLSQSRKSTESFRSSYHTKSTTCDAHQRNRRIPLERIFPGECIQKRRSAASQQKRVNSGKRYSGRNSEKLMDPMKHFKCHTITEAGITVEKEPRSYAQMIASYNEMMYAQNSSGIFRDNLSSAMINGIHRSPFSNASVVSMKWKNKSKLPKNTATLNGYSQNAKFSSDTATTYHGPAWKDRNLLDSIGENNLLLENTSYATMIEKYSNKLNHSADSYCLPTNMIHKRNVSTKFDAVPVTLMDAKSAGNKPTNSPLSEKSGNVTTRSTEAKKTIVSRDDYDGWVTEVDGIIKDLKRITAKNESIESTSNEKWMLQSVNEHAHWLDRVITAHKKKLKDKKPTVEQVTTIVPNEVAQAQRLVEPKNPEALDTLLTSEKDRELKEQPVYEPEKFEISDIQLTPEKYRELVKQPVHMSNGKPTNPISEYIRKGPVTSTARNTIQSPTSVVRNSTKEPQIELRMTPSQNESVVSINVNEVTQNTAGAKEQLSVIISSKKDRANMNVANARSDFASMQISISENTIPVKQIEFSINGKPVSELKSIVARADKLDVLGSMDKLEIRIPSKDSGAASKQPVRTVGASAASPVLNLQIAAKFNEPRHEQPRSADLKSSPQMPPPAPPPTQTPPIPHAPPKPRNRNIFTPNTTKSEERKIEEANFAKDANILRVTNDERSDNIKTHKVDTFIVKHNEAVFQRSDMSIPPSNRPRQPSLNNQNPSDNRIPENRTPSNVIPWWSSEDSFRKIKKKGNIPKSALTTFDDTTTDTPIKENINVIPKKEQKKNPDVSSNKKTNTIDNKKSNTESDKPKTAAIKKIVDEKVMSNTLIHSIQVKSPQKWKVSSGPKHMKPKSAGNNSRIVKRTKHHTKNIFNAGKSSASVKNDTNATTPSVLSPNEVKYIAVNPETGNLGMKKEADILPSNANVINNNKQKVEQKNDAKLGEEKSKVEKQIDKFPVVQVLDPQVRKANKPQLKDTVLKEEKNLTVNKSADVSAEGKPSTPKHSLGASKEEIQRKTDGSGERNLPSKPVEKDEQMKKILKSMTPIEKKKDGTLIDYGLKVPSRKPSGKVITRISRNPLVESSEKIIHSKNSFARKRQLFAKRKDIPNRPKTVESEKIPTVKKPIEATSSEPQIGTKNVRTSKPNVGRNQKQIVNKVKNLVNEAKILKPGSIPSTNKSTEIPNNRMISENKNLSKPDSKSLTKKIEKEKKPLDTIKVQKTVTFAKSDSKINVSKPSISQNARPVSANIEKTLSTKTVSKQTDDIKIKPSKNNLHKETTGSSEKKELKEAPKPAEKMQKELLQRVTVSPSKDTSKPIEKKMESLKGTIVFPPKHGLTPPEKKKELKGTIALPSKDALKQAEKEVELLKGTIVPPSKDVSKPAVKKIESLEGTIIPPSKEASKSPEKKKELERAIVSPSKDTSKQAEKKMDLLEEKIIPPSKDVSKPVVKKIETLEGTINSLKKVLNPPEKKKELEQTIVSPSKNTSKQVEKKVDSLEEKMIPPSKDVLKSAVKKVESLEGTIAFPSKDALKSPEKKKELEQAVISPSKDVLKSAEKKMKSLEGTIVSPSKNSSKPAERKKESFEGTVTSPPKVSDKTESKIDTFHLSKITESEEPITSFEKKKSTITAAPLQGTIDNQFSKRQDTLEELTGKEKKVSSEMSERRKSDPLKVNPAKKSSNRGGSDTESGGSMNTPTGPGGLRGSKTPTSLSKLAFNRSDQEKENTHIEGPEFIEEPDSYVLSHKENRPEKNILYASWLQRFKDRSSDDKTV